MPAVYRATVYRATVRISPRPSVPDPQGLAIGRALGRLGLAAEDVRVSRLVELRLEASSLAEAERVATEAARRLLANPVTEEFAVEVEEVEPAAA